MYVIFHLGVSVLGDFTFVVLSWIGRYEIMPIKYSGNGVYVLVLGVVIVGSIVLRVFLLGLFVAVRGKYQQHVIQYFSVMGQTFPPYKAP